MIGSRRTLAVLVILLTLGFAQAPAPQAPIVHDDGGPVMLSGEASYTFPYFGLFLPQPYVVLYDVSGLLIERDPDFVPSEASQVFGRITSDPLTSPFSYELPLPVMPRGEFRDVDQDGSADPGVMMFLVAVVSNTWGTPYLEQRDGYSAGILTSGQISAEPDTFLDLTDGRLLVFAADAGQGFPSGYGADARLFTADDPVVTLPQGYTLVDVSTEPFTFDRSASPRVALLEAEDAALDDFSALGWLEAYDALIDLLRRKYAFTDYKRIDWDALDAAVRPRVASAAAAGDLFGYQRALADLALAIPDGHVSGPVDSQAYFDAVSGGLGMAVRETDDGQVIVTFVADGGPADEAGIRRGAEILALNGQPIHAALEAVSLWRSYSTPHTLRLAQLTHVVRFPVGTPVEVTYRSMEAETTALLSTVLDLDSLNAGDQRAFPPDTATPLTYEVLPSGFGLITVYSLADDLPLTVALWERALRHAISRQIPGLMIDMRQNGGGAAFLGDQLPAYFFDEEVVIGNQAVYSDDRQAFVILPQLEDAFMLPDASLRYRGALAVLVSPDCASACESFAWAMRLNDRAAVVGHYPTAGLGGSVLPVAMPEGITFNYSDTRAVTAQGEISIEGIGVPPTVRVPLTLDTLLAEEDVLLGAAETALESALNYVEIGDVVAGTLNSGQAVRHHLRLTQGQTFGVVVEPDGFEATLRLFVQGRSDPVLEDNDGGAAALTALRAPADLLFIIEVGTIGEGASGQYTLRVTPQ